MTRSHNWSQSGVNGRLSSSSDRFDIGYSAEQEVMAKDTLMIVPHFKRVLLVCLTLQLQGAAAAQLVDGLGDPLPERAVARLGSSRLRHGGAIDRVMFSPDGRRLASWAGEYGVSEGIAIWEAATGKELRRVAQPGARLAASAWMAEGRLIAVLESLGKKHSVFDFSPAKVEGQALPARDDGDDSRFAISPSGGLLAVSNQGRDGQGYTVEFRELSPDRPAREAKVLRVAQGRPGLRDRASVHAGWAEVDRVHAALPPAT